MSKNKTRRVDIGSICKSKTGGYYLKVNYNEKALDRVVLTQGQFLNLETPQEQISSLEEAASIGRVEGDWVEKKLENLRNTPEWVKFNVSVSVPVND